MCKVTAEGFKMDDGTVIPFYGVDIKNISPKHIIELTKLPATAWDIFLFRSTVHDLKRDVERTTNALELKIEENVIAHKEGCPYNEKKVRKIAKEETEHIIASYPKKKLKSTSDVIRQVSVILQFIINIGLFMFIIFKGLLK